MPPPNTPAPTHGKNGSTSSTKSPSPSRNMPARPASRGTPDPVARTRSVKGNAGSPLSARASVRRPGQGSRSESSGGSDESKAEASALVEEMKEQLRKAETASEEYQRQAAVLQSKLDEALGDQDRLHETSQGHVSRIEALEKERQDGARKYRDLESAFESDKVASMKSQEDAYNKEQELIDTIQRLRESLASKEKRSSMDCETLLSRATSMRGRSSPNPRTPDSPDVTPRDSSQNNTKLIHQKDKIIESLRLELAEAQIKNVELENAGGGKTQELEKKLLEARMSNAKLLEDNESYQVLLQERTLNGSFGKSGLLETGDGRSDQAPPTPHTPSLKPVRGSLADELDTDESTEEGGDERYRKVEAELSAQKDQNKALTLYINKIITRLLQNETFEQLFENGEVTESALKSPTEPPQPPQPAAPKAEEVNAESARKEAAEQANAGSSFLQRAGSIFGGRQRGRPSRPKSSQPAENLAASPEPPTLRTPIVSAAPLAPPQPEQHHHHQSTSMHLAIPNEDPDAAPSIPLRRSASGRGHARVPSMRSSHKRSTSDWSGAAAGIVNTMHRNPSGNNGLQSPTGLASPRQTSGSFFPNQTAPPPLILEDSERTLEVDGAGRGDVASDSGYGESVMSKPTSTDEPASPRSAAAAALEGKPLPPVPHLNRSESARSEETKHQPQASTGATTSWFSAATAAVKKDDKGGMRPLRLVQEKAEADAERKRANRTSFMGWFQKGSGAPGASPPQGAQQPGGLASPPPFSHGHGRSMSSMPMSATSTASFASFEREGSTESERPGSQH